VDALPFFVRWTPLLCRELLKDPRVKVNEPENDRCSPLYWAAFNGHLDVIMWWIASGREMDLGKPGEICKTDAIWEGKGERRETEIRYPAWRDSRAMPPKNKE